MGIEMLKQRIETVLPTLNEKQRRIYLASEAMTAGYGGITRVHDITGISRSAIYDGIREIESNDEILIETERVRREGGGRKKIIEKEPEIESQIIGIVESHTKGDPERILIYTSKSLRNIAEEVKKSDRKNPKISHMTVKNIIDRKRIYNAGKQERTISNRITRR